MLQILWLLQRWFYKSKFPARDFHWKRGMAKISYPPQGGEKHLCFTLFVTMMMSVVSAVAIIYAIVIIYLPAKVVLESSLQGPKMCTTLSLEGNLTGIETCQDWSSCEEWCLSIVSSKNRKVRLKCPDWNVDTQSDIISRSNVACKHLKLLFFPIREIVISMFFQKLIFVIFAALIVYQ